MATTQWMETMAFLTATEHGGTWEDIATAFDISHNGVIQRMKTLRKVLAAHPEFGYAVPRPTAENGWRYKVTNLFVEAGEADIRSGHADDNKHALGILRRMENENEIAYERVVADESKRSSKARKLRARAGHLAAVIDMIEGDQGAVSAMNGAGR
jgi:hypothetical protein